MDYGGRAHVLLVFKREKCDHGFDFTIYIRESTGWQRTVPILHLKCWDNNDYPLSFSTINRYEISCICAVYGNTFAFSELISCTGQCSQSLLFIYLFIYFSIICWCFQNWEVERLDFEVNYCDALEKSQNCPRKQNNLLQNQDGDCLIIFKTRKIV